MWLASFALPVTCNRSSSESVLVGSGVQQRRRSRRRRSCPQRRVEHLYERRHPRLACTASVEVFDTDFDDVDEHVTTTIVNGVALHAECSPGPGYHTCASRFPVDADEAGRLEVRTVASKAVRTQPFVGDHVHVRHALSCIRQEFAKSGASRRATASIAGLTGGCDLRGRTNTADLGLPMGCMGIRRPSAATCVRYFVHRRAQPASRLQLCHYDAAADVCRGSPFDACRAPQSCVLSVGVWRTDFDGGDEYVLRTTANGAEVHGRCDTDQASAGGGGYYTCASSAPVWPDATGRLELSTEASEAVDGAPHDGSLVHVKHTLVCSQVGTARSGERARDAAFTFGGLGTALQCLLGIEVYKTGFGAAAAAHDESRSRASASVAAAAPAHVLATTANGVEVHGRCDPPQATVGADGWFACARRVPLARSRDGAYAFATNASCTVDENPHDGHELHVRYTLACGEDC